MWDKRFAQFPYNIIHRVRRLLRDASARKSKEIREPCLLSSQSLNGFNSSYPSRERQRAAERSEDIRTARVPPHSAAVHLRHTAVGLRASARAIRSALEDGSALQSKEA